MPLSIDRLAVADEVEAGAVEQVAMLDHHPMTAPIQHHEARIRTSLENLRRVADGIEAIIDTLEAQHRTADFAEPHAVDTTSDQTSWPPLIDAFTGMYANYAIDEATRTSIDRATAERLFPRLREV